MPLRSDILMARQHCGISIVTILVLSVLPATSSLAEPYGSPSNTEQCQQAVVRGRAFLSDQIDPELGLLPEYPGADRYWLWHDNFIAARVLATSHPDVSRTILRAIDREGDSLTDRKMELALGETTTVLPLRVYELREIRKVGNRRILNERPTDRRMTDWQNYADLLFYVAMSAENSVDAQRYWQAAMKMWDGTGFVDAAYVHEGRVYTTYKLALALIASRQLTLRHGQVFDLPDAVRNRLLTLQNDAGGWFTNYDGGGSPRGKTNVETTSLAVLGIEASLK